MAIIVFTPKSSFYFMDKKMSANTSIDEGINEIGRFE